MAPGRGQGVAVPSQKANLSSLFCLRNPLQPGNREEVMGAPESVSPKHDAAP